MPKYENPDDRNSEKIVIFTTAALKEKFQEWCASKGVTMSEAVREFMEGKK
jgi:antitoxin component of RelBE/YafQ-DinJ toxin-antitoxin module